MYGRICSLYRMPSLYSMYRGMRSPSSMYSRIRSLHSMYGRMRSLCSMYGRIRSPYSMIECVLYILCMEECVLWIAERILPYIEKTTSMQDTWQTMRKHYFFYFNFFVFAQAARRTG